MTQEINVSENLADLLETHNFDVESTDERGQPCQPQDAKIFKFDFIAPSGTNYGTAVITLTDDRELVLFFGDNLGKAIDDPSDKDSWFSFMKELKDFSIRNNFNNFSPKNINALKHTLRGMAAIKEGLFEGYYGNKHVSYMGEQTDARLVIKHNKLIGENDKRYRYVESLFIETADNERFKLPFKHLGGGRAMLEHVRQGGKPYDIRGAHITEMVSEMAVLARFNRASHQRMFEGVTQELVESATQYYQELKENIKHLASNRGYSKYFESWSPIDINPETALVEDLRTMFIEQTLDTRIEAALPTLAKIQKQGSDMKEASIFEAWANSIVEGTWALPDTPEADVKLKELMSEPLIVGPDATNATEQLYDIIGDDQLFDILQDLAARDPRANVWDDTDVQQRLGELGIQFLPNADTADQGEVGNTDQNAEEPEVGLTEGILNDDTRNTWDHLLDRFRYEVQQFKQGGELDHNLYDALFDYYSQHGAMPYEVAKAKVGDPYEWVSFRFADDLGLDESNSGMIMPEADPMNTFEGGSCNCTAEGEYCPEHGLAECGTVAGGVAPVVMGEEDGQQAFVNKHHDDAINYNAAAYNSFAEAKDDPLARLKSLAFSK